MKYVKQIAGVVLILVGAYFCTLGFVNDTAKFRWEKDRLIEGLPGEKEIITSFRRFLRDNPEYNETFNTKEHGALLAMGMIGGGFGGIGLIFLILSFVHSPPRRAVVKDEEETDDAEYLGPVSEEEVEEVGNIIDVGILLDEAEPRDLSALGEPMGTVVKYRTVSYLVTLAQGDMGEEHAQLMIRIYRPDMVGHLKHFSDHSVSTFGLQIARAVILRHRRFEAGTSDQQFRAQDDRIKQCENEIFARRYMPAKQHRLDEKMKNNVGKVFALYEQDKLQHEFRGESDEWTDLSLRNALAVMSVPASQDEAA